MVYKEREKKGKLAKGRWETKQDSTCRFSVTELTNVPIYYYFLGHHPVSNFSLPLHLRFTSMGFKRGSMIILTTFFCIIMYYSRSYSESAIKRDYN